MKHNAKILSTTLLAITLATGQAMGAILSGVALDPQGMPVSGILITVRDSAGKILGQTTTGKKGEYEIDNLGKGTLDLSLNPGSAGVQGGSGVLDLTGGCQMVNWQVSNSGRAVASQGGPCPDHRAGLSAAEWAAIGALGIGAGVGIGFGVSSATSSSNSNSSGLSSTPPPVSSSF